MAEILAESQLKLISIETTFLTIETHKIDRKLRLVIAETEFIRKHTPNFNSTKPAIRYSNTALEIVLP